ncbi:MAG: NADP-dependent 3-hydroxy acid dehydrogenase YdfG [Ancylomarina sp.]|jgi:NADP-dependent 3-hydroxy acid dehydrogenase YdfG
MRKMQIEGKIAFVSGSNRGIGKAVTIALLEHGAKKVYAGARDIKTLNSLKSCYGDRLVPVELDVTNNESIANAANLAKDVEILINNAGVFSVGNFLGGNLLESLQINFDVNVLGLVKLTHAFLETLRKQDSAAIASVSSIIGLASMPRGLTYCASKAAVHSVIQGLRGELRDSNILVSGVYPGPIDTDMTKERKMDKDSPENVAENIIKGLKMGEEDIFPDAMSSEVGKAYFESPKAVEEQFSVF